MLCLTPEPYVINTLLPHNKANSAVETLNNTTNKANAVAEPKILNRLSEFNC